MKEGLQTVILRVGEPNRTLFKPIPGGFGPGCRTSHPEMTSPKGTCPKLEDRQGVIHLSRNVLSRYIPLFQNRTVLTSSAVQFNEL